MINPETAGAALLLFAMLSLGSMVAIPGLSVAPTTAIPAFAQGVDGEELANGIIDDVFGADEEDEEEAADTSQTINQPVTQDLNQEVDQSETNDQSNDNDQTQTGVIDQDTTQGIEDGDDKAKSESESGDAKHKSHSSSSSGDAANVNDQEAENNAELNQEQHQDVNQENNVEFGDDTADLDAVNVAIPIAIPINVQEEEEEVLEEPDDEVPPPEEEEAFFCFSAPPGDLCFESLAECEGATAGLEECQRFETLPEGAFICRFEGGVTECL
jgi:hypothetical protein